MISLSAEILRSNASPRLPNVKSPRLKFPTYSTSSLSTPRKLAATASGGNNPPQEHVCRKRVFFLDMNSICYEGSRPSLDAFVRWISLFFTQVSLNDPLIAVNGYNANFSLGYLPYSDLDPPVRSQML